MTAIAWAIMFIGLMFYDRMYSAYIKEHELVNFSGGFTLLCLMMLIVCSIRELFR